MSNLKPGCRAIVIKGSYTGKLVKVGNFIGEIKDSVDKDLWEVDALLRFSDGNYRHLCTASYLQRIDDHPTPETIDQTETIDQPETIKTEKEVTA